MKTRIRIRPGYALALLTLAALAAGLWALVNARAVTVTSPRLVELGPFQAALVWETDRPIWGEVVYRAGAEPELIQRERKEGRRHLLRLTGLMPSTIYRYRLGRRAKAWYEFRTAPMAETAFRFMIYAGDDAFSPGPAETLRQSVRTELPDFVLLAGRLASRSERYAREEERFFASFPETARLPIYLLPGGGDLRTGGARACSAATRPGRGRGADYTFDYGNSRFVVLGPGDAAGPGDRLAWLSGAVAEEGPEQVFVLLRPADQPELARDGPLATLLGESVRERKGTAVVLIGKSPGTTLSGPGTISLADGRLVVDVDGAGVTGLLSRHDGSGLQVLTIRESPEAVQRSCIYCRKLLDARRYQESIDWYRDFISTFGERYLVDDAQFEIADIYDKYLYDYPNAIREYDALIARYPESKRRFQAEERLVYLKAYADYDFKPLGIYERAKNRTFQRDRKMAIAEIEGILRAYPGARIAPQVLLWLGYTLAGEDLAKACSYFRQAIAGYPAIAGEAWIALGDAYYLHRRYRPAIAAYRRAYADSGPLNLGLLDKLRKSRRNIARDYVLLGAILLLIGSLFLALWLTPRFLKEREIRLALHLCLAYLAAGVLIWALFFRGYPELVRWILGLAPAAAVGGMLGGAVSRKLFSGPARAARLACAVLTSFILTGVVCYILLYLYHYLPAFGV